MADKIIIFSGKQYSGKDTAAKILMEELDGYERCAMGDVIKQEFAKLNNLTYQEIEVHKSHYRQGLIDLGNWGRSQSPDFWLEKIIEHQGKIVVTDVRIRHEYDIFKAAGAITIRVEADRTIREARGGVLVGEDDITEIDLDNIQDWDFLIDNNSDYETLRKNVLKIVEKIR